MNSLFDKVSALVEINVRSLIGQSHRSKNAASFFRHYMAVEQNLIDVENSLVQTQAQMDIVVKNGKRSEEQLSDLDRIVDGFLLKGDDAAARKAQIHWNDAKRLNIRYRAQIQELSLEREKLLRAKDKLEVQLSLMQDEKERLQELYRQYKYDHGPAQNDSGQNSSGQNSGTGNQTEEKIYWVVDPE